MQHYLNETLVTRYRRIGVWMTLSGLCIIFAGAVSYFIRSDMLAIAVAIMFVGGVIAQFGTSFQNRFGRTPRADELIDQSIKGLNENFAIFHYYAGASHALFTPYQAYALIPRFEDGEIWYEDGLWKHQPLPGRFAFSNPRERVIRSIEREANTEASRLRRFLLDYMDHLIEIDIDPVVIFVSNDANVASGDATLKLVHRKKIKGLLKQETGPRKISSEDLDHMKEIFRIE